MSQCGSKAAGKKAGGFALAPQTRELATAFVGAVDI
jgi:hypothetical protein